MTHFTSARWCRILAVLVGLAESGEQHVYAQAMPCAGPPPAPANAAASIAPISPNLPAAVTIQWLGVPATGPNAVASYIVEAGNAPGAANVARFDTGTTDVSTVQMATNGTYFIRVRSANACGLSAPSPEPVVTIVGAVEPNLPAVGVVIGTVTRRADFGDVLLTGEVRGAWGARAAPEVRVHATFFNSAGQEVGREFDYVYGRSRRWAFDREMDETTVGAGETGCFAMYTSIPDAEVTRFTMGTVWDTAQLEVLRGDVVAQNVQQGADSLGNLRVQGQLRNAGTVNTSENHVHLDVRGVQDRVIDCDYAFIDEGGYESELAPGEVGSFVNFHDVLFAGVSRIRTWGVWYESDTGQTTPTAAPLTWQSLVPEVRDLPVRDAKGRAQMRKAAIQKLRTISKPVDAR